MQAIVNIGSMITQKSNIRQGRPVITGTGVTVQRIVGWYKLGFSPEEIADEISHLSLAQVYAGLAFYHANREQIDAYIAYDNQIAAEIVSKQQAYSIGEMLRKILRVLSEKSTDQMRNSIEFLGRW